MRWLAMRLAVRLAVIAASLAPAACGTMKSPGDWTLGTATAEPLDLEALRAGGDGRDASAVTRDDRSDDPMRWIRHHPPSSRRESRGVCFLLPGIMGSFSALTSEFGLSDDGWHVLVVAPPLIERVLPHVRRVETDGGRAAGAAVAREVDRVIGDASEALLLRYALLTMRDRSLLEKPVLIVGESLGALMGVGMAAATLVPWDAAVFVAGGASFVDVARGSSLRRLVFGDLPVTDPAFAEGFHEASRLDSLAAAPRLKGCAVCCITAAADEIVPTATQLALWNALGCPPRFEFSGGHLELFEWSELHVLPVVREVAARMPPRRPSRVEPSFAPSLPSAP